MKKIIVLNVLLLSFLFNACKQAKTGDTACISKEDSLKIKAWDALFNSTKTLSGTGDKSDTTTKLLRSRSSVTTLKYAQACAEAYRKAVDPTNLDINAIKNSYEEAVGFANSGFGPMGQGETILDWMSGLGSTHTHVLVVFGIYVDPITADGSNYGLTQDQVHYLSGAPKGKTTIFLWPKKLKASAPGPGHNVDENFDNTADQPFNFGDLIP